MFMCVRENESVISQTTNWCLTSPHTHIPHTVRHPLDCDGGRQISRGFSVCDYVGAEPS